MPLTPDQLAYFKSLEDGHMASLTEEQRAKEKEIEAGMADEAKMAEMMAEFSATFKAADTDGDGSLNFAEYKDFNVKSRANHVARGGAPYELSAEDEQKCFDIMVAYNPESGAGITEADMMAAWGEVEAAKQK